MNKLFIAAVVVGLALVGPAFARKQVLKNGSYERATNVEGVFIPDDWIRFTTAQQTAAQQDDGAYSALVGQQDGAFSGLYQDTTNMTEDMRVVMRAKARVPSVNGLTPGKVAGIKLEFRPPVGLEIPPPVENLEFDASDPLDVWRLVTVQAVVPPSIDLARCTIILFDEDAGGPVPNGAIHVDSAFAERSTQPGVNQLLNFDFEDLGSSPGPNGIRFWPSFQTAPGVANWDCIPPPPYVDGICGVRITGNVTAGIFQQINVTPGETLTFSAWFLARSDETTPPPWNDPEAVAGVKIEWAAGSLPTPGQIDIAPNAWPQSASMNIVTSTSPTDVWLPLSIDFTMPDNRAALCRATVIVGFGIAGNFNTYFDSFEMVLTNVFNGSDSDGDNDSDMHDIALLQKAFTGSGGGMVFGSLVFDHDEDNDVDIPDADFTIDRLTGPAMP